jgi:ketosteroid isomerase-like protein
MVLSWLAGRLLGYALARLSAGDPRVVIALYRPDVVLTFPGETSFGGVFRGRPAVTAWLRRFAAIGFTIAPEQVIAVGPPWRTSIVTRVHVTLRDDDGGVIYDNRGVIWGELQWGRMRRYEVFEDTVPAGPVDRWLVEHRPELAALQI